MVPRRKTGRDAFFSTRLKRRGAQHVLGIRSQSAGLLASSVSQAFVTTSFSCGASRDYELSVRISGIHRRGRPLVSHDA